MVYVEFNDEDITRVTEIKTPTNSLTLAINSSVEGTGAFSVPFLPESGNGMIVDESNSFCEHIFLVSVSSNGNTQLILLKFMPRKGARYHTSFQFIQTMILVSMKSGQPQYPDFQAKKIIVNH